MTVFISSKPHYLPMGYKIGRAEYFYCCIFATSPLLVCIVFHGSCIVLDGDKICILLLHDIVLNSTFIDTTRAMLTF